MLNSDANNEIAKVVVNTNELTDVGSEFDITGYYKKLEVDAKDAATLQSAMDYTDDNAGISSIADGSITTPKIADLSVTEGKLSAAVKTKLNNTPSLTPYSTTVQMTAAIATAKGEAITEANTQDDTHSTADRAYADQQDQIHSNADRAFTYSRALIDSKDASTLTDAKNYTFAKADITSKDTDAKDAAIAHANAQDDSHSTADRAYTDAEVQKAKDYTYPQATIDTKDATTLQSAKDYAKSNIDLKIIRTNGASYYVTLGSQVNSDYYSIVHPKLGDEGVTGDLSSENKGDYVIKINNQITYVTPKRHDFAIIYQTITSGKNLPTDPNDPPANINPTTNRNVFSAIIKYVAETKSWILVDSRFKKALDINESGVLANAEGDGTTASGDFSHAEGKDTIASGYASHAQGSSTLASGNSSHSQGFNTTAKNNASTISGTNGVLAQSDTIAGFAWGSDVPTDSQKTGSEDVGLVWKVDQTGNTTQTGTVKASGFLNADGTPFEGGGGGGTTVPDATDSVKGKVELATNAETIDGTDTTKAVTPASLKSLTSSTTRKGLIEIATPTEMTAGTATTLAATPKGVKDAIAAIPSTDLSGYSTTTQVETKDNAILAAAKVYTDENSGGGNAALESLVYDMEWKAEVQGYNNYSAPASPATIGFGYITFLNTVDFIFPDATTKSDIDALVLNRKFAFELPAGVAIIEPTAYSGTAVISGGYHRERYTATMTLPGSDTVSTNNNDYQTILYRGSESGGDVDLSAYSNTSQVDAKDATTLQSAKDYTFSQSQITQKDTDTLTAANTATDTKLGDYSLTTAVDSKDATTLQAAKDYTYPQATIDSKDSALGARLDEYDALPNTGLARTEQLTFFHDPNRINKVDGVPMNEVIDILKGSDATAKALYTERQTGSFVSEDNFRALTTEELTIDNETHTAIVATVPGNFNDYTFLCVEFNDEKGELAKTIYIPLDTIANGYDWVISDAKFTESPTKRELRVRVAYDSDSDTTKIKFHQEVVPTDDSSAIFLFISFFLKLTAKSATQVALDDYSLTTDIDAKDTAIKDAASAATDSKLESYYTKTQSNSLNADLQAAINTKEDSTHIFEHTPNYFTGGFIGGDSGYTFGGDLWGDAVGSLVAPNKGKITIMNTSYDIEIIAAYNNELVFGIHPDDEAETLAWFANKKIIFTGFVEGTKVEYSLLGSSALLQFSGSDFESFRFPYTANFLQENAQSLLIGNPFTVTIADVNAEAKTYVSKFDTIISNDPPINSVGSDGMTWIKEDGSNGHIRIDGVWKPKTNTEYSTTTAIDAKISGLKIKEKAVRVFANRALKEPANTAEGWDFKSVNTGILKVESGQETPTAAASLTAYKGMSIAVPKTIWNAMDKILITASHANQVALTTFIPVYKDDLVASIPKDVGFSGSGRLKAELFYDENKDQNENVNNELNRLVIQMKEGLVPEKSGFYIGEVVFTHLELVNTS